jgi:hypothetical protein
MVCFPITYSDFSIHDVFRYFISLYIRENEINLYVNILIFLSIFVYFFILQRNVYITWFTCRSWCCCKKTTIYNNNNLYIYNSQKYFLFFLFYKS